MISMAIMWLTYDKNVVCCIIIEHEFFQKVAVFRRTCSLEIRILSVEIRKSHSSLVVLGYPEYPNLQFSLVPPNFSVQKRD